MFRLMPLLLLLAFTSCDLSNLFPSEEGKKSSRNTPISVNFFTQKIYSSTDARVFTPNFTTAMNAFTCPVYEVIPSGTSRYLTYDKVTLGELYTTCVQSTPNATSKIAGYVQYLLSTTPLVYGNLYSMGGYPTVLDSSVANSIKTGISRIKTLMVDGPVGSGLVKDTAIAVSSPGGAFTNSGIYSVPPGGQVVDPPSLLEVVPFDFTLGYWYNGGTGYSMFASYGLRFKFDYSVMQQISHSVSANYNYYFIPKVEVQAPTGATFSFISPNNLLVQSYEIDPGSNILRFNLFDNAPTKQTGGVATYSIVSESGVKADYSLVIN